MFRFTITYSSGYSDIGECATFADMRHVAEWAQQQPGYVSHTVREVEA